MDKLNSNRTNEIKSGVSTNKDIELVIQEKDNKSQIDKKSSTKSSEKAGNKNIVRPYISEEKRKINHIINPNSLNNNTQEISENIIFNESDRKKLIFTNDVSEIENKSDILNIVNLEKINNKAYEMQDLNNQSFGNHEFYLKQQNSNKKDKDKVNEFFDDATLKSRKDKNLLEAFNNIYFPKDYKAKNKKIKSNLKNDDKVVLDMDFIVNQATEEDKRIQKIKNSNDKSNIINERSNINMVSHAENKDHGNNNEKQIKKNFQLKLKQESEKENNKDSYIFEIKEETFLDEENKKKFYYENSQIYLKEDMNNSDLKETLEFQTKNATSDIRNSNIKLNEKNIINGENNYTNKMIIKDDPTFLNALNIKDKEILVLNTKKEENKDAKEELTDISVLSEINRDSFGVGNKIKEIYTTEIKNNLIARNNKN